VDAILRAATPNIAFSVGVTALALVAPHVAAFGYLVIAVSLVLRARRDAARTPRAAGGLEAVQCVADAGRVPLHIERG
jgi:hypothetical protein